MRSQASLLVVLLFSACESQDRGTIAVESNDLGITEIEIRHDNVRDERLLTLRGFDRDGSVIATAVLRTGMVLYGADVAEEQHPGTELTVAIGEQDKSFVS